MASTSASPDHKSFKYDVFISFRGEDTRKNFVDHLYYALMQKSIHTYKDDVRITKGKRISDELITSIEDSRFYIVVFSKNYAASSWCLDELVKIMEECHKSTFHTAYPVFYDVEPTEIRKQSGSVGEAFSKLEKQDASAAKWRESLKEAADLAGWELKNTLDGHEAKFIQKIVEEISLDLRFIDSSVDGKLIGMESRVKDVISALDTSSDDVLMIGIKGMGGAGKTTLARAVYDHISFQFEGQSFVENVREVSKASLSGLKKLQKQVLSDVLNDQRIKVSSVHEGKKMMKKKMCARKVLLVLDDVDNIEQLEALAGEPNWFKPGSRIIITTRDEQVLVAHRVNLIRDVNLLSGEEAVCLFSRYAFGREIPIQGYQGLSGNVVSYAAGLPLTIRVLGSFLCGKNELEWKDAVDRLKKIPLKETLKKLELSYDGLEEDYKEIFLDVACILKGCIKDKAVEVLESCGFNAKIGLRVLEQKSLITISKYGPYLGMHDHIEEMGKNIVRRSHPDEPNRHSRLWVQEEIEDILANDSGTEDTRCINIEREMTQDNYRLETVLKGLGNMKKLRVLFMSTGIGDGINPTEVPGQCLPNTLRYLMWQFYPFEFLMKSFQEDHLVGLSLQHGNFKQLWKCGERKVLKKLRFLEMRSPRLRTLDLEMIPNIEMVTLQACDLEELHMPFECPKLKCMSLLGSSSRNLSLGSCPNLETLQLESCDDLKEIHMPFGCPKLKSFSLRRSALKNLILGSSLNLEAFSPAECHDLSEYRMSLFPKLKSLDVTFTKLRTLNLGSTPELETLSFAECHDLLELHMPLRYPKLKTLSLDCPMLRTLEFGPALDLETLSIQVCDLLELHMPNECPNLKSLIVNSSKLRTLNLGQASHLETLNIEKCPNIIELNMPFGCPKLKSLLLGDSKLTTLNLGLSLDLETLSLAGCHDLLELHIPFRCPKLKSLIIDFSKLRTLNLGLTPDLETLSLKGCHGLLELHMPFRYPKLKTLSLNCSKLRTLNMGQTSDLETLILEECHDLVDFHMPNECPKLKWLWIMNFASRNLSLGLTPDLEMFWLEECHDLLELRMPFRCPKLKVLSLNCSKLRTLEFGLTLDIEHLSIQGCDLLELNLPNECPNLKYLGVNSSKLRTLNLGQTLDLETLSLKNCPNLKELIMPFGCPKLKCISLLNSILRTLDHRLTPNLERLDIKDCFDLVELQHPIGGLEKLVYLKLSNCLGFKCFLFDKKIPSRQVVSLHLILESVDICPLHSDSNLQKFLFTCSEGEPISSLCDLRNLFSIGLCTCTNLEKFSESICNLKSLRKLTLEGSIPEVPKDIHWLESLGELSLFCEKIQHLPDSICMLKHLKLLKLKSCWLIENLPEDLGRLESLEDLYLTDCILLRDIPKSICELKRLKYFHLPYCMLVEKLPEEFGRLECLKELNVEGAGISYLPQSIFGLKGLRIIGSRWRLRRYGFTSMYPVSENSSDTMYCYIKQ